MYFTFDFGGILSILILSVKDGRRWGGVEESLLNGQNPLRMTKGICRQSLRTDNFEGIIDR